MADRIRQLLCRLFGHKWQNKMLPVAGLQCRPGVHCARCKTRPAVVPSQRAGEHRG